MAECIKTGACVYFPEFGTYVHGDLHRVAAAADAYVYVLYGNVPTREPGGDVTHEMRLMSAGFSRETQPYQIWVSPWLSEKTLTPVTVLPDTHAVIPSRQELMQGVEERRAQLNATTDEVPK